MRAVDVDDSCDDDYPWYGTFEGGDPRLFEPDEELATVEEIEEHRQACERWNQHDALGVASLPLKAQTCRDEVFGLGVNWCCKKHIEAARKT